MLALLEALLRESSAEPAGVAARALVLTALAKLSTRLPGQGEGVAALLRHYQGSIHLELQQVGGPRRALFLFLRPRGPRRACVRACMRVWSSRATPGCYRAL